ncbi:required for excision 1-B domain-containing protein-like [Centruroides vittatus]|uniref:required for excision 1-B domain-containing protein-like n=1 Tax=Centruroides vittatus TaxID=120091 RepID=UPI0035103D9E
MSASTSSKDLQREICPKSMGEVDLMTLLKNFYDFQEERVFTYRLFDEGHKIYLGTAPHYDFIRFRHLVHEVTQEFKRISEGIIAIEHRLRTEFDCPHLADFLANLQEDEKLKLELTAKLQLAKQNIIDHPDEPEQQLEIIDLKQRLRQVIERINEHLEELRYEMEEL